MKNKKNRIRSRQKSYLTAGVIALAAIIAMGGMYYRNSHKEQDTGMELAKTQKIVTEPEKTEAPEPEAIETMAEDAADEQKNISKKEQSQKQSDKDALDSSHASEEKAAKTSQEKAEKPSLTFASDTKISWPVSGNVLLNYSMDKTVYFATLDQYKYNPALIMEAQVNTKVLAAARGKVTDVSTNENTGITVTMDLGNGYAAQYGQLKEVKWKKGDLVEAGAVIGYIAEPTKYYSVEGSNLYFAMTKDQKPVDPMKFLK